MGRPVNTHTVKAGTLRFYEFAKQMSNTDFFNAMATFNTVLHQTGEFFANYDAWITPTLAQVASPHGVYGMDVDLPPREFLRHEQRPAQFMVLYNVTGQPAISLPLALHSNGRCQTKANRYHRKEKQDQKTDHPKPPLEPSAPSGLTSIQDEPDPPL